MKFLTILFATLLSFNTFAYKPTLSQRMEMADLLRNSKYSEMIKLFDAGYDPNDIVYSNINDEDMEVRYIHIITSSAVDNDIKKDVQETLKALIRNGAWIEATTGTGRFPVYQASTFEKLKILHEAGADIFREYIRNDGYIQPARDFVRTAKGLDYMYSLGMETDCDYVQVNFPDIEDKWYMHHHGMGYQEYCFPW
ncbi:hypothetical protein [Halobacteriovorax marinus]|uniref:hypothetical protein n=1 Tax=Halobacteriovorax marinus TaxID=97084 RepID=UPI0002DA2C4B|nr:hypothetical protein [Halobacteriovorax marinus]